MYFSELVKYYEKIESTTKRTEILQYLSELLSKFKNTEKGEDKDLERVIYLTQGSLYPQMKEQPKLGLAEKTLLDFLGKYYMVGSAYARKVLKEKGDIGLAAEEIARKSKIQSGQITAFMGMKKEELTIGDIYDKLAEISSISGHGAVEKKNQKLKWLLARCDPASVKYLMRIITSTLRLGVSDPTIMDAIAVAFLGDKKHREDVERAYNLHPDLGYIARIALEKGIEGLRNVKITVGIPIRMMLASRLNYKQILPKLGGICRSEFKLDGERLQVHKDGNKIRIFSRHLTNITDQYPDVAETVRSHIKAEKAIIEGEAVAMDPFYENMLPFQVLITRKRKYNVDEMTEKVPVCFFVFDVLYTEDNGKPDYVMDKPLPQRISVLKRILEEDRNIKRVEGKIIKTTEELVEYFKYARSKNCEGLMNKSIDPEKSVYKAGNRGFLWIKLKSLEAGKLEDTIDVVAIGAKWGKGKRANFYGTILVAVYNPETEKFEMITRVASGMSDDDLEYFLELFKPYVTPTCPPNVVCSEKADVWFVPAVVMEITGDEITVSPKADAGKYYKGSVRDFGYSIRFPVFRRIREDKGIYEITTVDEIIDMYEMQKENL